ncbi:MAG: hypothetical protein HPY85_03755 [Anaerolineae bacterium]|nr:hypothetical protein [Anaerolineae bacterium]
MVICVYLASLACSQDTISLISLTETAAVAQELGITVAPPNAVVAEETQSATGEISGEMVFAEEVEWDPYETPAPLVLPTVNMTQNPALSYMTQQGDTLQTIALRFNVLTNEITGQDAISTAHYLPVGMELFIPNRLGDTGPLDVLIADSEVIYSPSAANFDIQTFVENAGGYLAGYTESTQFGTRSGAEIVLRAATVYSINPRLLMAILEYQSGWVFSQPATESQRLYPMGYIDKNHSGLDKQLAWACQQISSGYYGWRSGILLRMEFPNGGSFRLSPFLNAGTVGVQSFFAQLQNVEAWYDTMYGVGNIFDLHATMFGNAWDRVQETEPLLFDRVQSPAFELPFAPGHSWNFTGGPHEAWGEGTAWAALDFAPMGVSGCNPSTDWVTSIYDGLVVRSEDATVVVDSDMDGSEQTGWVIFYFHIQTQGRIPAGVQVKTGDRLGHPSCEGGNATGTHLHIARKYNGEWIPAGGPGLPFVMSGWQAFNGPAVYQGLLVKNEEIIKSSRVSSIESSVKRPEY